jgi:hypothetical protein
LNSKIWSSGSWSAIFILRGGEYQRESS